MKSVSAVFILIGLCFSGQVSSQPNILKAEYFFDSDPGPGNGISISITAGKTVNVNALNIPTNSLSVGWHTLCVRTKDSNNVWGFYECRNIFIRNTPVVPPPTPPVTAMEYFLDNVTDPGTGTPITIASGATVNVSSLNIPQSLTQGWHSLHVRTKDQNNVWGFYETRSIYVRSTPVAPPTTPLVTTMEYFYDNVTAPGTGQSITITPGTAINVSGVNIPQNLAQGWHTLNVRTKDQNNVWGFYETRSVFVRSTPTTLPTMPPVTAMEYFYDNVTDPGTGQPITITTGNNITLTSVNLPQSLAQGWHSLHVRSKDQNNTWGFYETRSIFVRPSTPPPTTPPNIVQFEYFVDTDPGVGLSTLTLIKPPATSIDLPAEPLTVGPLSLGSHVLGLRAKDQNGTWSTTEERSFTVVSGCTSMTVPTTTNDTRCSTGPLNLTASGATGSQTYRWYTDNTTLVVTYTGSPFTTLSLSVNTDYYASIYDPTTFCEGPRTKASAIVSGIPKPTLNLTGSLTVCQGNSVTLQAPVGFSSYAWSNGLTTQQITVATGGSYSVIVGNGTCLSPSSDPFTFTVNPNPSKPIINAKGGGSLCGTGSVTLSAPLGLSTYSWSSGESTQSIDVNSVGNFTVIVTDANGCQSIPSDVFSVTSSALPKPIINVSGSSVICGSGTVQLSAPAGYSSYNWSDGSSSQTDDVGPGSYTVTVSSGGCVSPTSDPVVITATATPSKPTITVTGNIALCNGAFAVLSAPLGFSNYFWSDGSVTRQIVVNTADSYTVQVGNASNCMSVTSDPTITVLTGASCGSNLPASPTITNSSLCGSGALTLTASGATGNQTYNWYDVPHGNLLFTGQAFLTPVLSSTTDYYVTISDPLNGESNSTKGTATIVNIATPVLSGSSAISLCSGSSTLISAPNGFVSYVWSNGSTTQDVQINSPGNYSVQVGDGTCTSLSSNVISVSVSPAITKPLVSVGGNTTLCGTGNVQLTAPTGNGLTYSWSDSESSQGIIISTAGNYSVVVSNGICTSLASDPISVTVTSVLPKPTISVTGKTILCTGEFSVLTAPTSSFYLWSTGETTQQIVVNSANSFTVQVGNAPNCLSGSSDPTVITISGPCGVQIPIVTNNSRCGNGTLTLNAGGANNNQVYKWYDAPSGTLLFTGASFVTPSLSSTTNYFVTIFDAVNGESNPVKAMATVVNIPAPVLNAPSTISLCSGNSTLLSAPNGFVSYMWSDGSTTQNIQINLSGNYSVQVSDGTCTSLSSNVISVLVSPVIPKPVVSVSGNTTLCGNGNVQLTAPAGNGLTYSWSDSESTQSITVSTGGNYSVVVSNGVCTSPSSDPISVTLTSVLPKPTISVTGKTIICNGEFSVLSAPTSSFYLWSTGETTQQIVVNSANSFTVQVGNAPNCLSVSSDPIAITISGPCGVPIPIVTNDSRCGSGTLTLKVDGANNNQVYKWYDAPSGIVLFTGPSFVTPSLSTTTNYYVTIFDALNGESNPVKVIATVVNIPTPVLTGQSSITICEGNTVLLSAPSGYLNYKWSNNVSTQTVQINLAGSYSVQVSDGICTSPPSNSITVSVSPVPTKPGITITGSTIFCSDGSVDLTGPPGFVYQWSNGASTQKITVTESTVISLVVLNQGGCQSLPSDPVAITKLFPPCKPNTPPVIPPIPISVKIEGSVSVDLTKYISDAEDNIDWTRVQLLTNTTVEGAPASIDVGYNLMINYKGILFSGTDRITLEVYDLLNLSTQRVLDIEVVGEVVVFNGITPDGDGKNDFFYIQYLDVIPGGLKNKVTIFNRWGDVVFDISDYNNKDRVFAGISSQGNQLPPGTYFYRVDLSDSKPVTGYLTLKH